MDKRESHRKAQLKAQRRQDEYKPVVGADNVLRYVRRSPLEILKARLNRSAGATAQPSAPTALDALARAVRSSTKQPSGHEINVVRDDISERTAEMKRDDEASLPLLSPLTTRTISDGQLQPSDSAGHQEDDTLPPLEAELDDDDLPPLAPLCSLDEAAVSVPAASDNCECFACSKQSAPQLQREVDATLNTMRSAELNDAEEMEALLDLMEADDNDRPTPPMMTLADFQKPPEELHRLEEQRRKLALPALFLRMQQGGSEASADIMQELVSGGFEIPHALQLVAVLTLMLKKKQEREAEQQQRAAEDRKRHGNIRVIRSDAKGFFGRTSRATGGKIASISDYEIDLQKQLPPDWIPSSLNDILNKAVQYGKEPVLLLLSKLGQSESDIEVMDLYLEVCMPAVAAPSTSAPPESPTRLPSTSTSFSPFQGKGHSISGPAVNLSPSGSSAPSSAVDQSHSFDRLDSDSIQKEIMLDSSKQVARLQIVLPNGKKVVSSFNASHTVKDVKLAICRACQLPDDFSLRLITRLPKRTELQNSNVSLQAAGLLGGQVTIEV